jgi:hypothetical protein
MPGGDAGSYYCWNKYSCPEAHIKSGQSELVCVDLGQSKLQPKH